MKKLYLGMMLGCAFSYASLNASANQVSAEQVAAMQKQIEMLQKQLQVLSKQVKAQEEKVVKQATVAKEQVVSAQVSAPNKTENTPVFDAGYIAVPGTTAAVKFSGLVKLDAIMDGKNHTGEQAIPSFVPYDLQLRGNNNKTNGYSWNRHFYMHGKQSKICVDSVMKNASGKDLSGKFEGDFFGSTQYATGTASSSLNYSFRLRHAYLDYNGWRAGFTTTTFHMTDALLPSVDLNGIAGGNMFRQPLINYTYKFGGGFALTVGIENPRVDYVTYSSTSINNAPNYNYLTRDASSGTGSKPTRPDFISKIQYTFANKSMIGLSAIQRDLSIKYNVNDATADGRKFRANGYGANLTGKLMLTDGSFLTGGYIMGKGLGQYIIEMAGRSAIFSDITPSATARDNRTYRALPMYLAWAGYSHSWNKQFQTNVGFSYSKLKTTLGVTRSPVTIWYDPGLDKSFTRALINTIYKPENNMEVGLEYMFIKRQSTLNYKAIGNRYQLGLSYKF